ncbi:protease Do-like 7 [Quillaja saponaria]|uniref:Protease Do-like 7 n=1 Tax=Quillaja saponaria TaxID=32244 RepID=A0AAD7LLE0_QUISA|nr:protease Do-like 7 [Quillaja saponaria]
MGDTLERLGSEAAASMGLESSMKDELCMEIDPPFGENVATAEDWRKALNKVVPAVLVLRTTACRAFDTEAAGSSYATGFVVDKRRGIILTNRHVVKAGPVVAEAMFLNREEVPVYPIYRDPVHDFGFFRYDPGAIQFLNYEEIPLAPEAASVGLEIRVVGNDSGEKVSILAGTLARLDRDAPHYKKDGYNDFNTFYMQAASGTKGGSSGSPVIDWQGRAVALNAGSKSSSASAFFLPLERVVRALKFLQKGTDAYVNKWPVVSIPRGTLQVTFLHKGFDETRRLGLRTETEQMVRHASPEGETGMLVVDSVVPGGPGYKHLEPGDVLVHVNGEVVTQFLKLETLLDDNVGQKIQLQIERGGTSLTVNLLVQDLHSITPDFFLEVSGAVIHPLSYQQARNFRFHCGLVYVTEPGYMLFRAGVPRHAIIKKFAGEEISKLEDLISVLSKLSRGARVPLEYISYVDRHRRKSVLVTVDRHEWYAPPQIYTRVDSSGLWTSKPAFQPVSLFLSSGVNPVGGLGTQSVPLTDDVIYSGHIRQDNNQELTGDITSMETNFEDASEEASHQNQSDVGTKKRRVEENLFADGSVVADFSLNETRESKVENPNTIQDTVLMDYQGATAAAANASIAERVIEPTLVMFEVHIPPSCMLDGVHSQHFFGTGVIIYHSQDMGLVVVDKNTVAISSSDVMLSFAAFPMEIPGEVVFLHPVHNYALIAYDPSALGPVGASVVRAAQLLPEPPLRRGDSVYLVGLSRSLQATSRKSVVTNPCAALNIGSADSPRYRATNMEVIELDTDFGSTFSGVLTDEHGRVQAIWGSFSTQQPKRTVSRKVRRQQKKKLRPKPILTGAWPWRPLAGHHQAADREGHKEREKESYEIKEEGGEVALPSAFNDATSNQTEHGGLEQEECPNLMGKSIAPFLSFTRRQVLKFGCNTSEDHQFVRGIPIYAISQVLEKIISGAKGPSLLINGVKRPMPLIRILEVELYPTLLSKARSFGLSNYWIQALVKKDPVRRQVLRVKGCLAGSKAENLLEQGDMVLAINKEPVTCFGDIENAFQALDKSDNNDGMLNLTIFRQGHEIDILIGTDVRDGNGTTRAINWCGCIVQDPHSAVRALGFLPEEGHGVYVARWCHGSPVHRYGLYALQWIVEINGKPTPDLDAFVNLTKELEHGQFVRVKTVHLNGKPRVLTLKQDLHYWPTWELVFDPNDAIWHRKIIKAVNCSSV